MTDKYQNKYRISSARLQTWNYGLQASYFVTVCTGNRQHFFGEVAAEKMILSKIGKVVENEWVKTPSLRPDMHLELDVFCVMPNHFHAIIIIGENQYNNRRDAMHRVSNNQDAIDTVVMGGDAMGAGDAMHRVSTAGNKFGAQSKNLASVMRGFKSAVTVAARLTNPDFKWQERFHDHIIRTDAEFRRISDYIIENPKNWQKDKFYGMP